MSPSNMACSYESARRFTIAGQPVKPAFRRTLDEPYLFELTQHLGSPFDSVVGLRAQESVQCFSTVPISHPANEAIVAQILQDQSANRLHGLFRNEGTEGLDQLLTFVRPYSHHQSQGTKRLTQFAIPRLGTKFDLATPGTRKEPQKRSGIRCPGRRPV